MSMSIPFRTHPLGFQWPTRDPFLFCVHHLDHYPRGNAKLGPVADLRGRRMGMDFELKDGFRMYHGEVVPGFPAHPHRGFETVTLARQGHIDHADSMGAAARYGQGDVQWMTAGRGIVHCEMFPLLSSQAPNPVELFQIWLNLPARHKMVEPHFTMLWAPTIPEVVLTDEAGKKTHVTVMAGELATKRAPSPPPNSWAAQPGSDVAIWTIRLEPEAKVTLPAGGKDTVRTLYFFEGREITVAGQPVREHVAIELASADELLLENGPASSELLMLQGRPIDEPVVQHGPFVMNTPAEIHQAIADYQRTRFGGWPWGDAEHVHRVDAGRFARRPDGEVERPSSPRGQGPSSKAG